MTTAMLEYLAPIAGVLLGRALTELVRRSAIARQTRTANAFQLPTPKAALELIPARVIVPEFVKQEAAIVLLIYGEGARAAALMDEVDWSTKSDDLLAAKTGYDAVRAYLSGDHQAGYELSMKQARALEIPVDTYDSGITYSGAFVLADIGRMLALGSPDAEMRLQTRPMAPTWQPLAAWALLEASVRRGDGEAMLEAATSLLTVAPHAYGLGVQRAVEMHEELGGTAFKVADAPAPSWVPPRFNLGRFLYVLRPWMVYAFLAVIIGLLAAFYWNPKPSTGRNWFELPKYPLEPIGSR